MANSGYVPSQRTQDELDSLRTEVTELRAKDALHASSLAYTMQLEAIAWSLMAEDYELAIRFRMEEDGSDEYSALESVWEHELSDEARTAYSERATKLQRVMKVWAA